MHISSSNISMSAAQSTQTSMTSSASMRAWVDAVPSSVAAFNEVSAASLPSASGESQNALDQTGGDPTLSLLQLIVEMMVGHNIKLASVADLQPGSAVSYVPPNNVSVGSPGAGFGIEYQSQTTQTQSEQSDFQAQGVVQTSDGKAIAVQLDLAMRNQSSTQTRTHSINRGLCKRAIWDGALGVSRRTGWAPVQAADGRPAQQRATPK